MKRIFPALLVSLSFILAACTGSKDAQPPVTPVVPAQPAGDLTKVDKQGMVVVEVTPMKLNGTTGTLDFDVIMNTHSVDLTMSLAALAMLTTDTNVSVPATSWNGPSGGHHVRGTLSFPGMRAGRSILADATKLTLTIANVDAPSRIFEWELP